MGRARNMTYVLASTNVQQNKHFSINYNYYYYFRGEGGAFWGVI